MDVVIRSQGFSINDNLKEYANDKVGKLDRYLPNIREVKVDLSRQNTKRGENLMIAQITLRHARGAVLRAEEKVYGQGTEFMQVAISNAVDKMYRQIDRFKGKRTDRRRRNGKASEIYMATAEELAAAEEIPEYEEIAAEYANDLVDEEIVRRKSVEVQPMSEQEAIDQMELLGHGFFMFKNADTGLINVLYRRSSDGYGVLIPE